MKKNFYLNVLAILSVGLLLLASACSASPQPEVSTSTPAVPTLPPGSTAIPVNPKPEANIPSVPGLTAVSPVESTPLPSTGGTNESSSDPLDVIKNAMMAQIKVKAFRANQVLTTADGKTITNTIEYQPPDRIKEVSSTGLELVAIQGQGTWLKMPGGQFSQSNSDMAAAIFAAIDPSNIEGILQSINASGITFVGVDQINGKGMMVFTYQTNLKGAGPNQTDLTGTSKIWIGAEDGLPYKLETVTDSLVTPGKQDTTVQTFEYDPSIDIEPPQ